MAPIIRTLRDAIAQRKVLRLAYLAANGATERLFEPYYIAFRWSAWYVAGWCRLRGAFRMFRINRIVSLSPTDSTYAFRDLPASAMDPDRMFHQEHTETAVLLVHPSAEFKLLDAFGPDSYQADASGWLRFSFPYVNHDWMLGFIFSLADKARVLSPETLVRTVSERAQAMARLYDAANP